MYDDSLYEIHISSVLKMLTFYFSSTAYLFEAFNQNKTRLPVKYNICFVFSFLFNFFSIRLCKI